MFVYLFFLFVIVYALIMVDRENKKVSYHIYSSILSPYGLKVKSYFDVCKIKHTFGFGSSIFLQIYYTLRAILINYNLLPIQTPFDKNMDEFALVPYVFYGQLNFFDSTKIAYHIPEIKNKIIPDDKATNFVCNLMDEFCDEWGMYLFYHSRWAIKENQEKSFSSGDKLSKKYMLPGFLKKCFTRYFNSRQKARLPYLFSIPSTHKLLEESYDIILFSLEKLLSKQPFLLGDSFTLCDASIYGLIGTNIIQDKFTSMRIKEKYPTVCQWILNIYQDNIHQGNNDYMLSPLLIPLMNEIFETYVPLLKQMEMAYNKTETINGYLLSNGISRIAIYNQKAFDQKQSLFSVQIKNVKCTTVIKTFQISGWRKLKNEWKNLTEIERDQIRKILPLDADFN
jgi:glutathione S-transferase